MVSFHDRSYLLGTFLLVLLTGCRNDGPEVVPVTGTLTHKGKAVPNVMLTFLPDYGRQSWAQTDDQGRFKINYDKHQDGAVVGKHKVWIEYHPTKTKDAEPPVPPVHLKAFFQKYNYANSKYEVTITRDTREIELKLD